MPPQCLRENMHSQIKDAGKDRYLFGVAIDKENSHPNLVEQPAEGRLSL
ncbi:MAG: hypothetical protein ACMG6E_08405 [Candidatus Roizmanbacteria bacterium]